MDAKENVLYIGVLSSGPVSERALEGLARAALSIENATALEVRAVVALRDLEDLKVVESLVNAGFGVHVAAQEKEEDFLRKLSPEEVERYNRLVPKVASLHFNEPNLEEKVQDAGNVVVRIASHPSGDRTDKPTIAIPSGKEGVAEISVPGVKEGMDFVDLLHHLRDQVEAKRSLSSPAVG